VQENQSILNVMYAGAGHDGAIDRWCKGKDPGHLVIAYIL